MSITPARKRGKLVVDVVRGSHENWVSFRAEFETTEEKILKNPPCRQKQ